MHDLALNDTDGSIVYPPKAARCSMEFLDQTGAYLLDNGFHLFLWLGSALSSDWFQAVFNAPTAQNFAPEKIYDLIHYDNITSRNLCALLANVRQEHPAHNRLIVVRAGDPNEATFKRYLVEDRSSSNAATYLDYLVHIHKEVANMTR